MTEMNKKRYDSLDGLRTISCFGIILMHISANNSYAISGYVYNTIIPSFTNFVFLFMVLSAFGMCNGYYKKVLSNSLNLTEFYKKRYSKVLPFFACLVVLDLLLSFSKESLYEAIADISLTFGLFPNDISVIGVGWFLGLVFAFYMIFPFYCVLLGTKKRAWIFFACSLTLNYVCGTYFGVGRKNIVYSACYFIAGGLIYLYRDYISKVKWYFSLPVLFVSFALYYIVGSKTITMLFVSVMFVVFAIGKGGAFLSNRFTKFISGISLEMYLSHMLIFRVIEKLHLNTKFGNGIFQYIVTCVLVIAADILFSYAAQKGIALCTTWVQKHD